MTRDAAPGPFPIAAGQIGLDELDAGPAHPWSPDELGQRIVDALAGRSPHTVAAIADALSLGQRTVIGELVELSAHNRVRRIPGVGAERDRWAVVEPEPAVTVRCSAYSAHQLGHRRDPATGAFRCYVCDPEGRPAPLPAAMEEVPANG